MTTLTRKNLYEQLRLYRTLIAYILISLSVAGLVWAVYQYLPGGLDWAKTYRPAAVAVLSLKSPYTINLFHSPPWTVIPLLPFALLPVRLGYALLFWIGLGVTAFVAYRLGAKPLAIVVILLSYPILYTATYGNIEWIIFLGLLLPPRYGLFLLLIKPQSSTAIIIFWLIEAIRDGGIKKAIITFAPVTIALLLSFIIFGPWYRSGLQEISMSYNASLFPQSIPIGLAFLVTAIRTRRLNFAMIASPFLAPYLSTQSWGIVLLGLSTMPLELIASSLGIWILRFSTGYFLR